MSESAFGGTVAWLTVASIGFYRNTRWAVVYGIGGYGSELGGQQLMPEALLLSLCCASS